MPNIQGHNAADSGKPGEIFDLVVTPAMDAATAMGAGKATKSARNAKATVNKINAAKRAVEPHPPKTVLTVMHGRDGNKMTGVSSKQRQVLMRKQFDLGRKTAQNTSRDMPTALRDAHPNPPAPRNGPCAEHHAANKLLRVNDKPAETYTVTKTKAGKIKTMKRCTDCQAYGDAMGKVITDSKHPKLRAGAPVVTWGAAPLIPGTARVSGWIVDTAPRFSIGRTDWLSRFVHSAVGKTLDPHTT